MKLRRSVEIDIYLLTISRLGGIRLRNATARHAPRRTWQMDGRAKPMAIRPCHFPAKAGHMEVKPPLRDGFMESSSQLIALAVLWDRYLRGLCAIESRLA